MALTLFALNPEDLFPEYRVAPLFSSRCHCPWKSLNRIMKNYNQGSQIVADKDGFKVRLDVQQFAPSEITVKTVGREMVVEGKHEEKKDEHGFVSCHFVRKYFLPEGYAPEEVVSSLSSDGVLTIAAPHQQPTVQGERVVPIQPTGPVHSIIQDQAEENNTE